MPPTLPLRSATAPAPASLLALALAAASLATPATPAAEPQVVLDPSVRHQTIDGFGTCLISWGDFPKIYDAAFARQYVEEMGLSLLRCELSGFTLPEPVEKPEDIDHRKFARTGPTGNPQTFLDFARHLKALDPDLRIIGTVWSPPPWMKYTNDIGDTALQEGRRSGSVRGHTYGTTQNRVKPEYYPHYARWLVEMARLYAANGTPLHAISPGNEVMFTQWFQSCAWTAEDYATIVALLGDELEKAGMDDILIFGPETMTGHNFEGANPAYLAALRANPKAWAHLDVIATHGYSDGVQGDWSENSTRAFARLIAGDGKPLWITEGGTGGHDWPQPVTGVAAAFHTSLVSGNASVLAPWQISGERPSEHDLMAGRRLTKKSHAVRHYTRHVRPGAVRIEATATGTPVQASAFHDADRRTLAVVLLNPSESAAPLTLSFAGTTPPPVAAFEVRRTTASEDYAAAGRLTPAADGTFRLELPATSIVTLEGATR